MLEFNKKIQQRFSVMCSTGKLFRSSLTGNRVWETYIGSFSSENNPVFRDPLSSSKNCNHCKNFIRRYGNIVALDADYNIMTIFDVECDDEYAETARVLLELLRKAPVGDVFFETFDELNNLPYESINKKTERFQLGVASNVKRYTAEEVAKYGVVKLGEIYTFNHMHLVLDKAFVDFSGASIATIEAGYLDAKNLFQRAMETIPLDTLYLVRDLINQGSLLDGDSHLHKIQGIIQAKAEYDALDPAKRDNWCWARSYRYQFARFRNELIGVLCTELAEGKELNEACAAWNRRVDPVNYMKAKAPITQRQIDEARRFVEENGYAESFVRRLATIDDIKASEILHINVGTGSIKSVSIFDGVKAASSTRHKRSEFAGVEEVSIDAFMEKILPTCSSVEAFLQNSHEGNMVTLTTAVDPGAKPIFKWSNPYSWTFNGNLAGKSQIKEAVKAHGGKIDGAMRFSIIWNEDGRDIVDLDAHASEPDGQEINFSTYRASHRNGRSPASGQLDVDMINPSKLGVENIVWTDRKRLRDGVYDMWVNNFNSRQNKGFKAEVEVDGETYVYSYNQQAMKRVRVATVSVKSGVFSVQHHIPESAISSKDIYGLHTNEFHRVNLVCLSPNHWGDNRAGNKHYFFMLEGCRVPTSIRSFHNENLLPDLLQHRKVLEVLGATRMIEPADSQLSGLGFNATVRDELVVKLGGTHKRMVKIKF